ncbi:MAG: hypothetical protein MZU84_03095 [Sphingobacterium sp.]|nr:hypothetical protein [Sphingobacterium sp.]
MVRLKYCPGSRRASGGQLGQYLGMLGDDSQQAQHRSRRREAPLLPVAQRRHGRLNQVGELRLRKPKRLACGSDEHLLWGGGARREAVAHLGQALAQTGQGFARVLFDGLGDLVDVH